MAQNAKHKAMIREAQLAAGQICAGATALCRADDDDTYYYSMAFFGLSIGIERLCKQIFIADFAYRNNGCFPTNHQLKNFSHDLEELINSCEGISKNLHNSTECSKRPNEEIHKKIVSILSEFSKSTRYFNLDYLTQVTSTNRDPIERWQNEVEPLVYNIYCSTRRNKQATSGTNAEIYSHSKNGVTVSNSNSIIDAIGRDEWGYGEIQIVKKFGKMYALQIIRWLKRIANDLSEKMANSPRTICLAYFHEPYVIFENDDKFFCSRRTFNQRP